MTKENRRRLRQGLDKFGLLETLIVNRKTKHVLGGHQRLLWMDETEEGNGDYDLQVSYCDVDERYETTILALLNQPNAQGEWDTDILARLITEHSIDLGLAGFEQLDIEMLMPEIDASLLFASEAAGVAKTIQEMEAIKEQSKQDRKEKRNEIIARNDTENYVVIVFGGREEKAEFLARLGLPGDERYVSPETIESRFAQSVGKAAPRNPQSGRRKAAAPHHSGGCG